MRGPREIGALVAAALIAATAATPAQMPTLGERIEVRLVEVELWATSKGKPVLDLLQSELQLFDDGQPVDIGFFTPPPPVAERPPAASPQAAAPRESAAPPAPDRGTVAIFLDDAHLAPAHRARVVGELIDWLEQRFDAGTAVTVVRFSQVLELVAPRNLPRDRVVSALREVTAAGARAIQQQLDERRTLEEIREWQRRGIASLQQAIARAARQDARLGAVDTGDAEVIALELPCSAEMLRLAEDLADRTERVARESLAALGAYAASLAAAPGRKVLLYVSDGVPLRPGGPAFDLVRTLCDGTGATQGIADSIDVSALPPTLRRRPGMLDRASVALAGESRLLANPLADVAALANAGGVTIWTLGARGLTTSGVDASSATRDRTGADEMRQRVDLEASLTSLAAETGGRALLDLGDFGDGLDEMAEDLGSSYLLAFVAPRIADGRLHRIRVETTRQGVRLRHRQLWRDTSGESELGELVSAALLLGIDRPGLRASAEAVRLTADSGAARTVLRVVVPESALSLLPAEGGVRHGVLRVAIAVRAPGGEPSPVRSRTFPIERPPSAEGAAPRPVAHDIELPLLPAGSAVVVGLLDEVDGDIGVLRVEVEAP